jgi:ATP-binding cassette subfamily G (WHITE) protein 2 (PDR)
MTPLNRTKLTGPTGWASWLRWINPISYGFESVLVNEFSGRDFPCASFVPSGTGYEDILANQRACAVKGSVPGADSVSGSTYIRTSFGYENANKWRNVGILLGMTLFLLALHLITSELVTSERSKGEVLVFRQGKVQKSKVRRHNKDEETGSAEGINNDRSYVSGYNVEKQTSVFHWENVCYEIQIKGQTRAILDHVDGWVMPGTLTALMGVSGAGKTTLLDVLASRTTVGVITGSMVSNPIDSLLF